MNTDWQAMLGLAAIGFALIAMATVQMMVLFTVFLLSKRVRAFYVKFEARYLGDLKEKLSALGKTGDEIYGLVEHN